MLAMMNTIDLAVVVVAAASSSETSLLTFTVQWVILCAAVSVFPTHP